MMHDLEWICNSFEFMLMYEVGPDSDLCGALS